MTTQLKSDNEFGGYRPVSAMAPLPEGAIGWVDFMSGLHMTQTQASAARDANFLMQRPEATPVGIRYGLDGPVNLAVAGSWSAPEFGDDGQIHGQRCNNNMDQRVTSGLRGDNLTGAALTGATAAYAAGAAQYQGWTTVTPASGAASSFLQVSTGAIPNGYSAAVAFDVSGVGVVQIGLGSNAAQYATFDLLNGVATAQTGVEAAMVRRVEGWTIQIAFTSATASDAQIFIASVAAVGTALKGAPGLPFRVRFPRFVTATGTTAVSLMNAAPWPYDGTTAAEIRQNRTSFAWNTNLLAASAEFSAIFRLRSGWMPSPKGAGMFGLVPGSGSGLDLRFNTSGALMLWGTGNDTLYTFSTIAWEPEALYRIGVSRDQAGNVNVAVNDEVARVSFPSIATATPYFGRATNSSYFVWDGHIQRLGLWSDVKSAQQLKTLCRRYL